MASASGNGIGMVLPPPPFVSARQGRGGASTGFGIDEEHASSNRRHQGRKHQPLISSALSELSFDREAVAIPNDGQIIESSQSSSLFSQTWNSILCLSLGEDGDLYFDAEELPLPREESGMDSNGKLIAGKSKSKSKSNMKDSESELKNATMSTKTSIMSSFSSFERINSNSNSNSNSNVQYPSIGCVSMESVEVKLEATSGRSSFAATTICQYRGGGQQPHQPLSPHSASSPIIYGQGASASSSNEASPQNHRALDPTSPSFDIESHNPFARIRAPPPPKELPLRFLRAGKGDPDEGQRRYEATLQWRKENSIDTILLEAHPEFEMIKSNYPHYFHLRGRNGEPVFFEQPPKTDLEALRRGGMDLHGLVRHYAMVTEFQWQFLETDDLARSIFVLDLDGIRMMDFVGECVEYVKMCSQFTGQHYPERAGHVIVINVPRWFAMIWKVVKPMVDDVTLKKISIVRGKDAVFAALSEKISPENIPPEYGGSSMPLGDSPEEHELRDLMRHNNALANGDFSCGGRAGSRSNQGAHPAQRCRFCSWGPIRSY